MCFLFLVAVAIYVNQKFQYYSGGIYDDSSCQYQANHAVCDLPSPSLLSSLSSDFSLSLSLLSARSFHTKSFLPSLLASLQVTLVGYGTENGVDYWRVKKYVTLSASPPPLHNLPLCFTSVLTR